MAIVPPNGIFNLTLKLPDELDVFQNRLGQGKQGGTRACPIHALKFHISPAIAGNNNRIAAAVLNKPTTAGRSHYNTACERCHDVKLNPLLRAKL